MSSKNSGLGYTRLKEKNFPFDLQKGGEMEYKCKGCGHVEKCDPRKVPTKCPECYSEYPFFRVEKVAA